MPQLLVFTRNNTHEDPVKNKQDCYKIGDVIIVEVDDHVWGSDELVHPFRVVHVAGSKSDYEYLLEPKIDSSGNECCRRAYSWIDGQAVIK
jgi:hypothetical protein